MSYANTAVYLVTGSAPNDRVRKVASLRDRFEKLLLVRRPSQRVDGLDAHVVKPIPNPVGVLRRVGLHRSAAWIDRAYFPNTAVLYAMAVERNLRPMIAADLEAGHDVSLITCAPPHAVCIAGLRLKQRFPAIRWIVDWQDLWSYDENYFLRVPRVYRPAVKRLEARILDSADVNVTTNTYAKRVLEENFGADRVVAIHHHFDRADLDGLQLQVPPPATPERPIRIGFLGNLCKPPRVPGAEFISVVRQLRRAGTPVELHVHGRVPREFERDVGKLEGEGMVFHGPIPQAEGIARLGAYDFQLVLLADLANSRAVMSIKLPHYLLTNRPIIAVVPDQSAIAEIIRNTGCGYVVDSGSDWSAQLANVLSECLDSPVVRNDAEIEKFSWTHISKQWLATISQPIAQPSNADERAPRPEPYLRHTD